MSTSVRVAGATDVDGEEQKDDSIQDNFVVTKNSVEPSFCIG